MVLAVLLVPSVGLRNPHLMRRRQRYFSIMRASLLSLLSLSICMAPSLTLASEIGFKAPDDVGLPGRRVGGGTRGPACLQGRLPQLVALSPSNHIGYTSDAFPRFFWYMPTTATKTAEFTLYSVGAQRQRKDVVYRATFDTSGTPGIATLKLPRGTTLPGLKEGQYYSWTISVICNPEDRERDIRVSGWVRYMPPEGDLADQLATASESDRLQLYAENGYWFDLVATLAKMRADNPRDEAIAEQWSDLLRSQGLGRVANQQVISCCESTQARR
jgi:hypothetical protein